MIKTVKSYAKINLGLWINNVLSNGYHEIQTVFMLIDWYDELTFQPSSVLQFTVTNEVGTELDIENNICLKAAKMLQKETCEKRGAFIHLKKRIPVGGGLGGGSSNAAVTLLVLNRLWELDLPVEKLSILGAKLGADVPFFLCHAPLAIAEGIGEKIMPVSKPFPFSVVIAFPNMSIETTWAYKNHRLALPKPKQAHTLLEAICQGERLYDMKNDFEPCVFSLFPAIKALKMRFLECGADASMLSGIGGAVFGVFKDEGMAYTCYDEIGKIYPSAITNLHR